ncbi:MAG: hypothetical protein AAF682_17915 [Planctomycetota bacterium]
MIGSGEHEPTPDDFSGAELEALVEQAAEEVRPRDLELAERTLERLAQEEREYRLATAPPAAAASANPSASSSHGPRALVRGGAGRRGFPWPAAAAGLLIGLTLGWLARGAGAGEEPGSSGAGDPDGRVWLSGGPEAGPALFPSGAVDAHTPFVWSACEDGAPRYRLKVWNASEPEPAFVVEELDAPRYTPTAAELAQLGPSIQWEVWLLDPSGLTIQRWGSASASLSSR